MATIDPITGLPSSNVQKVYPGDRPISSPSPTIDATKLGTVAPITVPVPSPYNVGNYTSAINNTAGSIQAQTDAALAEQQAQQKLQEAQAGANDLATLQAQMGGKAADTANLYQSTGVNSVYNQLQDLNAQATGLKNEASAIPIANRMAYKGTAGTENQVQNVNYDQLQQNALKALSLGQQAAIAESNFNKAKNLADQQVEIKYGQMEADLKAKQTQLDALNKYQLTPAQEKAKSALERQYKLQDQELADKKAREKSINALITGAAPYAPPATLAKAKELQSQGKSEVEVAIALGKYGGDYLGDLVKYSTINKNNAEYDKTMKEIKALGQAPQINAPAGTNANFIQNLAASAVNKESLSQTERTAVTKNLTVLDQLDSLQANIAKQNNGGFIKGKVNNLAAALGQNADVGTINAQLQAIVPNLARGVYGEVGVLTDNDIANYRKTLPNLTMPKDQNDAVLALTLKAVQKNLKNTLETAANSKMDVSRFAPQYQQVTQKINEINDRIGVSKQEVIDYGKKNPQTQQMIADLSAQGRKPSEILQILGVEN